MADHPSITAANKASLAPGSLTDADIALIRAWDGDVWADEATAARAKAWDAAARTRLVAQAEARRQRPASAPDTRLLDCPADALPETADRETTALMAKHGGRIPTMRYVWSFLGPLTTFVTDMNAKNVERNTRLDALEARVAGLESRPSGVTWAGTFTHDGRTFVPGDLVTKGGSLWVCTSDTTAAPGAGGPWKLVVKSGAYR